MFSIDRQKFTYGLRISFIIALVIQVIAIIFWMIIVRNIYTYPFMLINLGLGGMALIIAGALGPGRFKQQFPFVLYSPRDGGTYSKFVKVAAYRVDPEIEKVNLMINGSVYDELEFRDDHTIEKVYRQKDILDGEVNFIWLESGDLKSNKSLMTFYDPDDFTEEEVAEIEKSELDFEKKYTIQEARQKYLEDRGANVGSFSLGIITAGLVLIFSNLVTSYIYSLF